MLPNGPPAGAGRLTWGTGHGAASGAPERTRTPVTAKRSTARRGPPVATARVAGPSAGRTVTPIRHGWACPPAGTPVTWARVPAVSERTWSDSDSSTPVIRPAAVNCEPTTEPYRGTV